MNSSPNEMKLIIPKGCDNAPRKQIIIDFTVAILQRQNDIIMEYVAEDVIWYQLKDNKKIEGQRSFVTFIQENNKDIVDCLEIYQVITHGKFASINGVILLASGTKVDFCDVYMFSNSTKTGKIKEIKSYHID